MGEYESLKTSKILLLFICLSTPMKIVLSLTMEERLTRPVNLLYDDENEWVGLSIESDYNVHDHINTGDVSIYRKDGKWHLIFNKDVQVVRYEKHGCITDLYNNNYTGIELILLKGVLPKRKYIR